jgi:hypothetical protein
VVDAVGPDVDDEDVDGEADGAVPELQAAIVTADNSKAPAVATARRCPGGGNRTAIDALIR